METDREKKEEPQSEMAGNPEAPSGAKSRLVATWETGPSGASPGALSPEAAST